MTEKLKQVIKEEMEKLPKETQEAVNAFDWAKITEEIGGKYLLNESEINDLQVQTLLVLIGLTDADFYETSVENEVGTTKDESKKITGEIFQRIFSPIADIITENIKKKSRSKSTDTEQTLNFILSGGDYSSFIKNRDAAPQGIPSETNKINTLIKPGKMTDIKSKLVI
jgi:hypothetical protein